MHDLVIDNALVIDGLGAPAQRGGVAVKDGRIAAVGADLGAAQQRVDAGGLVLAPGIVDIHTHYDAQLTWDPFATPSTSLGVTTVVIGNCGFTIAPCRPPDRDLTLRALTHVEGMSLEALRAGVRWDFESYPEYLDAMEQRGVVPNVASFVGHSSVRTYVLGADATKRPATDAEIAEMRRIVLEAVRAGAIGFATSTAEQHNGENGVPMPSRLADERELMALTGALGEAGRGVFMLTKGMTSTIPWLEKVAAANGRPVMIAAMFIDPGDPTRVFREVGEIEAARTRGRELWAQVGCFPLGMEFTLRHPYPLEAFLAWRPAIEATDEAAYRRVLADPSFRKTLKEESAATGRAQSVQRQDVAAPDHHGRHAARAPPPAGPDDRRPGRALGAPSVRRVPRLRPRRRAGRDVRLPALQHRRERGAQAAAAPARGGGAVRRRRAPVVPVRRRLRPAPVRSLGARARRPHAGRSGQARDQRRGVRLSHPRAWTPGARRLRRPDPLRSPHGGTRATSVA